MGENTETYARLVKFHPRPDIASTLVGPDAQSAIEQAAALVASTTGPTGPAGPTGPTGPAGPIGTTPTVAAGSTSTGLPGSSALVVNSGTSTAAVFDFTIPRGAQGFGVALGGAMGQVLTKIDATDGNTYWATLPIGTVGTYPALVNEINVVNTDVAYDQWLRWVPKAQWNGIQDGTGTYDASQALVDACQSVHFYGRKLFLPQGRIKVTDTWHIWFKTNVGITVSIEGFGTGFTVTQNGTITLSEAYQTIIDATASAMKTRPAVNIEMARGVKLKGMVIWGPNDTPNSTDFTDYSSVNEVRSTWLTSGVSNTRKSPQCGIAIDAFGAGLDLSDSYPQTTLYGKHNGNGSFGIEIEDVVLYNHNVCFMDSPSGSYSLGDFINIKKIIYANSAVGHATQGDVVMTHFTGGLNEAIRLHTFVDTESFGNQAGWMPHFAHFNLGTIYQLMQCSQNQGSAAGFTDCYAENIYRFGVVGGIAHFHDDSLMPDSDAKLFGACEILKFKNCEFRFNGAFTAGKHPHVLMEASCAVEFDSCNLYQLDTGIFAFIGRNSNFSFRHMKWGIISAFSRFLTTPLIYVNGDKVLVEDNCNFFWGGGNHTGVSAILTVGSDGSPLDYLSSNPTKALPPGGQALVTGKMPVVGKFTHSIGGPGDRRLITPIPDLVLPAASITINPNSGTNPRRMVFTTDSDGAIKAAIGDILLWRAVSMNTNTFAALTPDSALLFPAFQIVAINLSTFAISADCLSETLTGYDTGYSPSTISAVMFGQVFPDNATITTTSGSISASLGGIDSQDPICNGMYIAQADSLSAYTRFVARTGPSLVDLSRVATATGTFTLRGVIAKLIDPTAGVVGTTTELTPSADRIVAATVASPYKFISSSPLVDPFMSPPREALYRTNFAYLGECNYSVPSSTTGSIIDVISNDEGFFDSRCLDLSGASAGDIAAFYHYPSNDPSPPIYAPNGTTVTGYAVLGFGIKSIAPTTAHANITARAVRYPAASGSSSVNLLSTAVTPTIDWQYVWIIAPFSAGDGFRTPFASFTFSAAQASNQSLRFSAVQLNCFASVQEVLDHINNYVFTKSAGSPGMYHVSTEADGIPRNAGDYVFIQIPKNTRAYSTTGITADTKRLNSTAYTVGQIRWNNQSGQPNRTYQCIIAGSSTGGSAGPTGTGSLIADGGLSTVFWKYLGDHADFT